MDDLRNIFQRDTFNLAFSSYREHSIFNQHQLRAGHNQLPCQYANASTLVAIFMTNPVFPIAIGIITFIIFIFLLVTRIKIKSLKRVFIGLGILGFTVFCFFWLGIIAAGKAYTKGSEILIDVKKSFEPRTGEEIYNTLFGPPADNCLTVLNKTDQIVPRLDCCIWLDFRTCPLELRRIIALEKYKSTVYNSIDTAEYIPTYSPMPVWWTPYKLNKTITVLTTYDTANPNRNKILIFAKDSSHAYYCDMAD